MTEYTKQIKQLTKQASQTPQFQAPSQSLGGDIVNALGTGLEFFQQQQAKEQLDAVTKAERDYEEKVARAAIDMGNFMLEAEANGLPAAQFEQMRRKRLSSLGSSTFQRDVISAQRKMTGNSAFSTQQALKTQADKDAETQRKREEDRFKLEQDAVTEMAKYGAFVDPSTLTDQELQRAIIKGKATEGVRLARIAALEEESKFMDVKDKKQDLQSKTFEYVATDSFVSDISARTANFVYNQGGVNPTNVGDIVSYLEQQKAGLRNEFQTQYVDKARGFEIYVSQEVIDKSIERAESALDAQITALQQSETLLAIQSNTSVIYEGTLLRMLSSDNENERNSAGAILGSKFAKSTIASGDFKIYTDLAADVASGRLNPEDPRLAKGLLGVMNTLSPLDPEKASGRFDYVNKVLEGTFNGTTEQQKAVVRNGGHSAAVKVLAQEGSTIVDPLRAEEHVDNMLKLSSKSISGTIAALTTQYTAAQKSNSTAANFSQDPISMFDADVSDGGLKFIPNSPASRNSKQIRDLNSFVKDNLKVIDNMIMDEERRKEIRDKFINDVLVSVSISPNK